MAKLEQKSSGGNQQTQIAIETLHADMAVPFLQKLQAELVAQGLESSILLLPETESLEELKPLLVQKSLLASPKSAAMLALLERGLTLKRHIEKLGSGQVVLLNQASLSGLAWYGSLLEERSARVKLFKWLDELEYMDIARKRPDLTLYIDILPEHLVSPDEPPKPAGWAYSSLPNPDILRQAYLEAAALLPSTKVVQGFQNGLLLPDQNIYNKIWNLVRRVVLPKVSV